jgi:tetratricopeptide (TPR) repeat protein
MRTVCTDGRRFNRACSSGGRYAAYRTIEGFLRASGVRAFSADNPPLPPSDPSGGPAGFGPPDAPGSPDGPGGPDLSGGRGDGYNPYPGRKTPAVRFNSRGRSPGLLGLSSRSSLGEASTFSGRMWIRVSRWGKRLAAKLLLHGRRPSAAAKILERLVDEDLSDLDTRRRFAWTLTKLGRHEEAAPHWRDLMSVIPADTLPPYSLAESLVAMKRYAEAVDILRQMLANDPSDTDVLSLLARAHVARAEYQDALLCYRRLLHIAPDDPCFLNDYAATLLALGHSDDVVAVARKALALEPSTESAWILGTASVHLNRWADAVEAFRQAVALDPSNKQTRVYFASTLARVGRYDEAMETLSPVLAGKADAFALAVLCVIRQKQGRIGDAVEAGRSAVQLDSASRDSQRALGFATLFAGQPSEALTKFTEALRLEPGDSYAELGYGAALSALQQHAQAVASFDRALAEDSECLEAYPEVAPLLKESRRQVDTPSP